MIGLRLGIALLGFTLLSWLVSYYSSEEKRNKDNAAKNASGMLGNSLILGSNPTQADTHDHIAEGMGHEDGGGDDFCDY